jgi:hypothetical protein
MPLGLLGGSFGVPLFSRTMHPEVIGWFSRVRANGGNASAATLEALSEFCRGVDSLGLRSLFYRLNLFCGSNLSACLVPLYRGPTLQGPLFGHPVDANYNFASSDYTETGASGGLTSSNTKYLITGLAPADFVQATSGLHMGFSSSRQGQQFGDYIGTDYGNAGAVAGVSFYIRQNTGLQVQSGTSISSAGTSPFVPRRFIASTTTTAQNRMIVAGAPGGSFGNIVPPSAGVMAVFGKAASATTVASPNYMPLGVFQMYSIGAHITAEQSLAIDTLLRSFNAALRRDRPSSDPAFDRVGHPEAREWIDNVYANGGTVSTSTASAVNDFCNAIDAAGLRDRFYRLNLFAGTGLAAALVPLYRGQSLGGTQFGNATDTNSNFVAADYNEASGLISNGSSKWLNTGLPLNFATGRHIGAVLFSSSFGGQYLLGAWGASGNNSIFGIFTQASQNLTAFNFSDAGASGSAGNNAPTLRRSAIASSNPGTGGLELFLNGTSVGAGTAYSTTNTGPISIFGLRRSNEAIPQSITTARMSGYTIGTNLSAADASAINSALATFNAAMGRDS